VVSAGCGADTNPDTNADSDADADTNAHSDADANGRWMFDGRSVRGDRRRHVSQRWLGAAQRRGATANVTGTAVAGNTAVASVNSGGVRDVRSVRRAWRRHLS
jgi:hypothetical protein